MKPSRRAINVDRARVEPEIATVVGQIVDDTSTTSIEERIAQAETRARIAEAKAREAEARAQTALRPSSLLPKEYPRWRALKAATKARTAWQCFTPADPAKTEAKVTRKRNAAEQKLRVTLIKQYNVPLATLQDKTLEELRAMRMKLHRERHAEREKQRAEDRRLREERAQAAEQDRRRRAEENLRRSRERAIWEQEQKRAREAEEARKWQAKTPGQRAGTRAAHGVGWGVVIGGLLGGPAGAAVGAAIGGGIAHAENKKHGDA